VPILPQQIRVPTEYAKKAAFSAPPILGIQMTNSPTGLFGAFRGPATRFAESMITHRIPLDAARNAFDLVRSGTPSLRSCSSLNRSSHRS